MTMVRGVMWATDDELTYVSIYLYTIGGGRVDSVCSAMNAPVCGVLCGFVYKESHIEDSYGYIWNEISGLLLFVIRKRVEKRTVLLGIRRDY